ncbi:hypothetical protein ACO0SA_001517 [Hanseniaspora valbyensis]
MFSLFSGIKNTSLMLKSQSSCLNTSKQLLKNTTLQVRNNSTSNKKYKVKTRRSLFNRLKIVPLGPVKPKIPNTEVEQPSFAIMTKRSGVAHGNAGWSRKQLMDKRGFHEPNKIMKRYIKSHVHNKAMRKLINW